MAFAVGQLAVDHIAQGIVGVFSAVVCFEAVAFADVAAFQTAGVRPV
ncbi:hypothetical protein [Neisseria dumasiana]